MIRQRPLRFDDSLGHPIAIDANCVVAVRPALRPPEKEGAPHEPEPGIVAIFLTHQPGTIFVKGDFDTIAWNIFKGEISGK